jgi:hypothetical protein
MTHDKLLVKLMVMDADESEQTRLSKTTQALRLIVELHTADFGTPQEDVVCDYCKSIYPCLTIQAIEKELL